MSQHHSFWLRRTSKKRLLLGGIGSSIGILGVIFSIALYVVESLIRPKKYGSFSDIYSFSPFEFELPAENVTFAPLYGDYAVSGWYIPRPQATTTIVMCPGYRTRMADVLGMTVPLWKAGHNVLVFEYYGHGQEVGRSITLGYREINDFLGALVYAKERAPGTRLGVLAYSMGASVAIMCSARSNDVEALVADSAFASHWSVVDYNVHRVLRIPPALFMWVADYLMWWRAGYRFRQVEPVRDIERLAPRPVLIIHGGKDTMVDPRDATKLYNAANEPKELWIVPEANHCGAYFINRRMYVDKILAFFEQHLKMARPHLQLLEPLPTTDIAKEILGLSEKQSDDSDPDPDGPLGLPEAS